MDGKSSRISAPPGQTGCSSVGTLLDLMIVMKLLRLTLLFVAPGCLLSSDFNTVPSRPMCCVYCRWRGINRVRVRRRFTIVTIRQWFNESAVWWLRSVDEMSHKALWIWTLWGLGALGGDAVSAGGNVVWPWLTRLRLCRFSPSSVGGRPNEGSEGHGVNGTW